jgi:hypothetical protein
MVSSPAPFVLLKTFTSFDHKNDPLFLEKSYKIEKSISIWLNPFQNKVFSWTDLRKLIFLLF